MPVTPPGNYDLFFPVLNFLWLVFNCLVKKTKTENNALIESVQVIITLFSNNLPNKPTNPKTLVYSALCTSEPHTTY
jgi:hypothetical protein